MTLLQLIVVMIMVKHRKYLVIPQKNSMPLPQKTKKSLQLTPSSFQCFFDSGCNVYFIHVNKN